MSSNNYGVQTSEGMTGIEKLKFVLRSLDLDKSYLYYTNPFENEFVPDLLEIEGMNEGVVSGDELRNLLIDAVDFDSYDWGNGFRGVRIDRRVFVLIHLTRVELLERVERAEKGREHERNMPEAIWGFKTVDPSDLTGI